MISLFHSFIVYRRYTIKFEKTAVPIGMARLQKLMTAVEQSHSTPQARVGESNRHETESSVSLHRELVP